MKWKAASEANEVFKQAIKSIKLGAYAAFHQRTGKHIVKPDRIIRLALEHTNFRDVTADAPITIFDVGANRGQSSTRLRREFPNAKIHAFEPFAVIFEALKAHTQKAKANINCVKLAMSNRVGQVEVARAIDPKWQLNQIFDNSVDKGHGTETLELSTLDTYCAANGITKIDILKTDTEGHDLEVLQGAEGLLRSAAITHIIAEGTLRPGDTQHTSLFGLLDYLKPLGYDLFSMYELAYGDSGRIEYFNVHFLKRALMPPE